MQHRSRGVCWICGQLITCLPVCPAADLHRCCMFHCIVASLSMLASIWMLMDAHSMYRIYYFYDLFMRGTCTPVLRLLQQHARWCHRVLLVHVQNMNFFKSENCSAEVVLRSRADFSRCYSSLMLSTNGETETWMSGRTSTRPKSTTSQINWIFSD